MANLRMAARRLLDKYEVRFVLIGGLAAVVPADPLLEPAVVSAGGWTDC